MCRLTLPVDKFSFDKLHNMELLDVVTNLWTLKQYFGLTLTSAWWCCKLGVLAN